MKLIIRSFPGAPGWDSVGRAGRRWPATGTEVEFVDSDEDPPNEPGKPVRIGRKSLEALRADPRINVSTKEAPEDVEKLKAQLDALQKGHGAAKDAGTGGVVGGGRADAGPLGAAKDSGASSTGAVASGGRADAGPVRPGDEDDDESPHRKPTHTKR
jgi:hypothetical protein